jgi:hypothetical protein
MNEDAIQQAATCLVEAGALGRSVMLKKLFDYLLERSLAGSPPKEAEVALAVFGDSLRFNTPQDASVRVYVHRLRLKLTEYYAGPGAGDPVKLDIPKGEYRLTARVDAEGAAAPVAPGAGAAAGRWTPRPWMWLAAFLSVIALNIGLWATVAGQSGGELAKERRAAPWASLLGNHKPTTVVIGDYYIFGDIDRPRQVDRLLREYSINSPIDLDDYRMAHPEVQQRYVDLDLYYLPVSSAFALKDLMPLLAPTAKDRDQIHIALASDVSPEMLRRTNIVYVGYLSGLGILRDAVFAGSRFTVGETYDVLIDQVAQKRYASQEGRPNQADEQQRDLGYFASFPGPNGNRIVILAGARDMGVTQMAEEAVNLGALAAMHKASSNADAFEALYEVQGVRRSNFGGKLLVAAPLKADRIWSEQRPVLQFPKG